MAEQMVKEKPERAVIVPKQNHVLEVKDLSIFTEINKPFIM